MKVATLGTPFPDLGKIYRIMSLWQVAVQFRVELKFVPQATTIAPRKTRNATDDA